MNKQTTKNERDGDNLNSLVSSVFDKLSPNRNIVGIDGEGKVFEGYDGNLDQANNVESDWMCEDDVEFFRERQLTKEERTALANEMIKRWTDYKTSIC